MRLPSSRRACTSGLLGAAPPLIFRPTSYADPVAFGLEVAALFFEVALLARHQLQAGEVERQCRDDPAAR